MWIVGCVSISIFMALALLLGSALNLTRQINNKSFLNKTTTDLVLQLLFRILSLRFYWLWLHTATLS